MEEERKCKICGEIYKPINNVQKYCSRKCRLKASNRQKDEWRRINPEKIKVKEHKTILCRICGKPVEPVQGAFRVNRPQMHEACIFADIRESLNSGNGLSRRQLNRMDRLGITLREISEIHTNGGVT